MYNASLPREDECFERILRFGVVISARSFNINKTDLQFFTTGEDPGIENEHRAM